MTIVKKMARNDKFHKTKAGHVHDTLDYLTGQKEIDDKVLHTEFVNIEADSYEEMKDAVINLAEKSPDNCKNPLTHIVISFRSGEVPTLDQTREMARMMLEELKYQDCQYVYSIHKDTDNYHLHIAVNRVDPNTKKVHWNYRDTDLMHKALVKIEAKQGWSREQNALFVQVGDEIVRTKNIETITTATIPKEARAMEAKTGEQSAARIAAEEALPILLSGQDWDTINRQLAEVGCRYAPKGAGSVLKVMIEGREIDVKPSSLHKKASLKYMTDRLGSFVPSDVVVLDRRAAPLPGVPQEPFQEYRAEREAAQQSLDDLHAEHERLKDELKAERKSLLAILQDPTKDWTGKGEALAALQKVAGEYHKEQLASLAERFKEKIKKGKHILDKVTDFETWTALKHPESAKEVKQAINSRNDRIELNLDVPLSDEAAKKYQAFADYHEAVQADRYRITSKGEKDGKAIAYVFGRNAASGVADGTPADQVHKYLHKMLWFASRGEHIYLTPISDTTNHVLVDDLNFESLERMKYDGIEPNVVVESSPGNFQAVVNFPKFGDAELDKIVSNKASEGLNKKYGDVNLSGAIHPHRAPDFPNTKEKHQKPDGSYPLAKVVSAKQGNSEKLTSFALYMRDHIKYLEHQKTAKKRNNTAIDYKKVKADHGTLTDKALIHLYDVHRHDILKKAALTEAVADWSRIDAMIAVRLRGTGHTEAEIAAILAAGAPRGRGAAHNWPRYAAATAASAWSPEATQTLARLGKWRGQWKALEQQKPAWLKEEARERERKEREATKQRQDKQPQEIFNEPARPAAGPDVARDRTETDPKSEPPRM